MRTMATWMGAILLAGGTAQGAVAAGAARVAPAQVEAAVIAKLPVWQGHHARILAYLDLGGPFATASPWALVVARAPGPPADPFIDAQGPLAVCFVKALVPQCVETYDQRDHAGVVRWHATMYRLIAADVVDAEPGGKHPLLLVQSCSTSGINGSCNIRTVLFAYAREGDAFSPVFVGDSDGSNNNQAARFVRHGPLQGDVIVDYPTAHAPYRYWIEVFAPGASGQYARILRYRGQTGYGDGNPLAVADSEMPGILRRLGKWKPGDALPVPLRRPPDCVRLTLRHGEEWCD